MRERGEDLIDNAPSPPFWGAAGTSPPAPDQQLRATDRELAAAGLQPKSIFQLAGPGAVGRGSIRGMPLLLSLRDAGFSIWPFDAPGWPRVVEIYPRALTGPVDKGRFLLRQDYLEQHFSDQTDKILLERAAGSEDAFDAAVSAIVMSRHAGEFAALEQATDADLLLEGAIWRPPPEK